MSTRANGPAAWFAAPDPALAEPMIDCDNHCYEARDSFTRYLPAEYLDQAVTTVVRADGSEAVIAGDRVAVFNTEPGGRYERAPRPGSLKEMLRQMATADPDDAYHLEAMRPEYVDRDARLRLMDTQGVDKAIIYPARRRTGLRAVHRQHRCALRQHPFVQPLVPRDLGFPVPPAHLRAGAAVAPLTRTRRRGARLRAR